MTLEEFCQVLDLELVVRMRSHDRTWIASLKGAEVMENGMLVSEYGDSTRPDWALRDYAKKISGKRIVVNAMTESRKEYNVPELT